MKKVLYITNKEVPYKVKFFNQLSEKCNLTVIFETNNSNNRDEKWAKSVDNNFEYLYLSDSNNSFFKLLKILKRKEYDVIIFGCITDKKQLLAMTLMRIFRRKYVLNLDGEIFIKGRTLKDILKRMFIKGASVYLVAGEKSAESIREIEKNKKVIPYYFSSLTDGEIEKNSNFKYSDSMVEKRVLVIGQYFEYKGLDIALKAAEKLPNFLFKFIGMGYRTEEFLKLVDKYNLKNVEVIPFLQKSDLESEYKKCEMLLLPSRQECWGLVINEAASFGIPIVSTYGSGAAVEFLEDSYKMFLAKSEDYMDLAKKIVLLDEYCDKLEYSEYLKNKSKKYSIEKMVETHESLLI